MKKRVCSHGHHFFWFLSQCLKKYFISCSRQLCLLCIDRCKTQFRTKYSISMVRYFSLLYLKIDLKGHSQLWDRADLDTSFASLKSVYLNLKSNVRVRYIKKSAQSCLLLYSILDLLLKTSVFTHPFTIFYHIWLTTVSKGT